MRLSGLAVYADFVIDKYILNYPIGHGDRLPSQCYFLLQPTEKEVVKSFSCPWGFKSYIPVLNLPISQWIESEE